MKAMRAGGDEPTLGEATGVGRRAQSWVLVLFAALAGALPGWAPEAAGTAAPLELPVVLATPAGAPASPITVWAAGSDGQEYTVLLPPAAQAATLALPAGPPWRVGLRCPGHWSATHLLAEPPAQPLRLELWPAAELALEVLLPQETPPVAEVLLFFTPQRGGGAQQPPAAQVRCPVREGRVKGCLAPAGTWQLRLEAGKFAPHVLWDVQLAPQGQTALGRIRFYPGATLVGRLTGPPEVALEAAKVRAAPALAGVLEGPAPALFSPLAREGEVDGWGRFALPGLAGGVWAVTAAHPACPAAPLTVTVPASAGLVELPQPLTLRCPAVLEVRVSPAEAVGVPGLAVEVYPWMANEHAEETAAAGELPPGGSWRSPPLPAGKNLVVLVSPAGPLARKEVELAGEDVVVELPLATLVVAGRLLQGRRGVAAQVEFWVADGASTAAEADEEGHFLVTFPRPGQWEAFVRLREGAQIIALGKVEVKPEEVLTLRLPSTRVRGEVRQSDGVTPAPDAAVELTVPDGSPAATAQADRQGRFDLSGVPAGRYSLQAASPPRRSRPLELELVEGRESSAVLLLEDPSHLRCRVTASQRPVLGARVVAWGLDAGGRPLWADPGEAATGPDGVALLTVPPGAKQVWVVAMAPGYALQELPPLPLPAPGETLAVGLTAEGGTLLVPDDLFATDAVLLLQDGRPSAASRVLAEWAFWHGKAPSNAGEWEIPMLPPGRYRLCRLSRGEVTAVLAGFALPRASACSPEGFLAPGGTLSLPLPSR